MNINGFNHRNIFKRLNRFGKFGRFMISIVNLVFNKKLKDLFDSLNGKFTGARGRPAFPREMLMAILLYAYFEGDTEYCVIEKNCRLNRVYCTVTCNCFISYKTFERFMDELSLENVETLFEHVLKIAKDYGLLDLSVINIDGSIGLTSGSKHNKIYFEELKTLVLAKKHGLLLNKQKSKSDYLKVLEKKIEYHKNCSEKVEILKKMCLKPKIYIKNVAKKINIFEKEFQAHDSPKFLFANNPWARLMKTKHGNFDACLNTQLTVNNNHIITSAMISQKTTDNQLFGETIDDFIKTHMQVENYENKLELLKKHNLQQ